MPGQNSLARPDVKPDAPPPPGTEHQADSQELANNAHDTAATAAAIAAMGSLAGHHLQDQGHSAGSPGHDPNQMPAGLPMTDGQDGGSPSGRGHPKKKGPEMDRQRKDNHVSSIYQCLRGNPLLTLIAVLHAV